MSQDNNNTLLPQHETQLIKSGISFEVIQARGYRSVTSKQELARLGFASFQQQIPALLIPQFSVDGNNTPWGYQIRPDRPRMSGTKGKAKPVKYEFPAGAESHLDINPLAKPMLKDTSIPLWFTEGAKKADALASHGQCAINLPGVNGFKAKDESGSSVLMADFDYLPFNDRLCYLCFDSDWQTNKNVSRAVNRLAEHLRRKGAAVVFIRLPMSGVNKNGIDDYLADGHSIEDVKALSGPDLDTPAPVKTTLLPKIICNNRSLDDKTNDTLQAIIARNNPPKIFIRNRKLVEVVKNEAGTPSISELDDNTVRCVCALSATFINKGDNEIEISPPLDIVKNSIAKVSLGLNPFPVLRSIAETPYITADGTIVTLPGYNPKSQIFYSPALDFKMPEIPESPDSLQVEAAKNLLLEVIVDFPFDSDASRANSLATMMTPPLRPGIKGCVPLAIFDKPQQGTGASLLANVDSAIGTGRPALMLDWPHDDAELQKTLATFLRQGQTIITYDNAAGTIFSTAFCRILTSSMIAMRLLGGNESIEVPNQQTWMMTGNNLRLDGELIRRSYRIGLDAQSARPWLREVQFKHPDLMRWVLEERGRIIAAILTVYRAWVNAGQPKATITPKLASFQEWVDLMSALLGYLGIEGFLVNLQEMYDKNDTDTPQWEGFITAWYGIIGNKLVTVPEIVSHLNDNDDFAAAVPDSLDRTDKNFNKKFGQALLRKLNVRFPCGLMIKTGKTAKHNLKTWQIEVTTSPPLNVNTSSGSCCSTDAGKSQQQLDLYSVEPEANYPNYPLSVKHTSCPNTTSPDADNPAPTKNNVVDDLDAARAQADVYHLTDDEITGMLDIWQALDRPEIPLNPGKVTDLEKYLSEPLKLSFHPEHIAKLRAWYAGLKDGEL